MHGCMIPHPCGHTVSPWMQDHHLRLKLGKTQLRVIPPNQTFHHNVDIDQLFKATRLLAKAIAPDGPECVLQTTQGQVSCADLQGTNWTCSLVLEQSRWSPCYLSSVCARQTIFIPFSPLSGRNSQVVPEKEQRSLISSSFLLPSCLNPSSLPAHSLALLGSLGMEACVLFSLVSIGLAHWKLGTVC